MIDYLGLIPSQHRGKQKFEDTISVTVDAAKKIQEVLLSMPAAFDVDSAIGRQLDAVGAWVGMPRKILSPVSGVYFTWSGTAETGWGSGVWKSAFDSGNTLIDMPDDVYRSMIKAKIAANQWDGTINGAYQVWDGAFGSQSAIVIRDNQDMSMSVSILGETLPELQKQLLFSGALPLKPAGVRVNFFAVSAAKAFAWGVNNQFLGGWGVGAWAETYTP
jgi:hypothetical protein